MIFWVRESALLAILRALRNQRRAQAYSVPRIANPTGITSTAGPGVTIRIAPKIRTVPPPTVTMIRLMCGTSSTFSLTSTRLSVRVKRPSSGEGVGVAGMKRRGVPVRSPRIIAWRSGRVQPRVAALFTGRQRENGSGQAGGRPYCLLVPISLLPALLSFP